MRENKIYLFLIFFIFIVLLPFFYLHQGLLLIDTGREFYIPTQILTGDVLYKNIFIIYGPFSYQFNAILFLIFGQKISTLAVFGIFNSLLIIFTCYFISCEFLKKSFSFLFALFVMFSLVFQTFLYNSNLTYCFAIVYALSSFLLSLLFLIKYLKTNKINFVYLSCLFAGISIANKYEFIFYVFILAYFIRNIGFKNLLKAFLCFTLMPLISYGALFLQGLNFYDIKKSFNLINNLITAPLIKYFFFKTAIAAFNNGIFSIFTILPVLNIILFFINKNEIIKNKPLFAFILCAVASSAKSLFSLNVFHMGVFLLPMCFLALIAMLNIKYQRLLPFFIIFCILLFASEDFNSLKNKNYLLSSSKGNIHTYQKDGNTIKQVSDFIFENTKITDKIIVLPEGCIINFITERKGDNIHYNLDPLMYFNVFGEDKILNYFKFKLPEYFVILPIDKNEYGYKFFGKDYAANFHNMILKNYNTVYEKNNIIIFKKKYD